MASVPPPGRFSGSFYIDPLTKLVYVCHQGGPGAPGLKGDSGDSGPQVRTLDQPASISPSDLRTALFTDAYVLLQRDPEVFRAQVVCQGKQESG